MSPRQVHPERLALIGVSAKSRVLYTVFAELADDVIRIVAARKATTHERKRTIFVAPDSSRDTGFYMQEDGNLIRLTRPPGAPTSKFAVDKSAIDKNGPKLVGGVLHTASGKFVF
jgi:hypothetical protein